MRASAGKGSRGRALLAFTILLCLPLGEVVGSSSAHGGSGTPEEIPSLLQRTTVYTGMSLEEALLALRGTGLKIIFSSNVVSTAMRVEVEPQSSEPLRVLEELLEPHGLEVQEGPGETLVVVPGRREESVEKLFIGGFVRVHGSGVPVAGALVRDLDSGSESESDAEGRFLLALAGTDRRSLEASAREFLPQRLDRVVASTRASFDTVIHLDPVPVIEENLSVAPSRISLLQETPIAPLSLGREELEALPHLGGDFYRALTLLPGTTGNDVSAQFYVRGGRRDETQILIDGQELYEGFHLQDRDSALSLIAPEAIGTADLNTGGFAAEYGDRMSGVLEMATVVPTARRSYTLGLGVLSAHGGGGGISRDGRQSWLAQVRRGTTDLVGRLLGAEDPEFWDAFGKIERQFGSRHTLRFNGLYSRDVLDFRETVDGESKHFQTEYGNSYLWLTHRALLSSRVIVESAASIARIQRDRRGVEDEEGAEFLISDDRDSEVLSLRQSWDVYLEGGHLLDLGWQVREFDTEYDYVGTRNLENPLAQIRHDYEQELTSVVDEFEDLHHAVHLTDRFTAGKKVTLQLGARWDSHSLTYEDLVSPRLNIAWAPRESSVFRLAWGRFTQSQRPYELSVEDGEKLFHPIEKSSHRILGYERFFARGSDSSGVALRVELYRREVDSPRPQYVNLFEPLNTFPEIEPDRVLIEPDRSLAEGLEIFVRSGFGSRLGWWVNYSYAATEDRIDGRWTPRLFDQTHSVNLDVDYRISDAWRVNAAWRYHTGWPTTPLTLALESGGNDEGEEGLEVVPVLGPLNSDRISDYHRLDLRLSRQWRSDWGTATFFIDVQNLYDRENVAGFDIEIDEDDGTLYRASEGWTGILPSAGFRLEF